ncbi:alcohol dehydrogenase [Isoalcanivorax pacificus W11-5]|uniref:Alcohol dehydrogenase n=1 Tax=Isoalcanivorax pacificus W11-5 TaxID=391936 RepID=A0A0B4XKB4_9GAMM|nr:NADPH:quinone oxidoreductase family protein [Isoalcanivorax pacificus]AJD46953.1 alcohol dehydrogenase [Isoalcanivorax pacificus W11-5]
MRALQVEAFSDPSALKVSDIPERTPGKGEVMLEMAGVGVGYFDGLLVKGEYQIKPPLPFVPGSAIAGVVVEVGEGVTHVAPGDHVAAFALLGGMAEKVTLPAQSCVPLPKEVPLLDAANFFIAYATGLYGLRECGHLKAGETLLVLGASGTTGSTAIELGKAMGARVIACASTEEKRQRCLKAGADVVIDYTQETWRKEAKAAAGGQGVDVVYDPVGGDLAEPALRLLAPGGRYLVVGFVTGIARIPLNLPLLKRCAIIGVNWGGEVMGNPAVVPPVISQLVEWTLAGKLKTAPDHVYPMAQAGEAFAALFERRSSGKIVVTP